MTKHLGFTLAEVLITLAIIGVVAAMTLPTIIINYQKKQTVVQLKKAYTELSNAVKLSEVQNGNMTEWDYTLSSEEFADKYLSTFVKVDKSLVKYTEYKNLNGAILKNYWIGFGRKDSRFKGNTVNFTTSSGVTYIVDNWQPIPATYRGIIVDINGSKRGPNVTGKDVFGFIINYKNYENKIVPAGIEYSREKFLKNYCIRNSTILNTECTALIVKDNWEIKSDYPW